MADDQEFNKLCRDYYKENDTLQDRIVKLGVLEAELNKKKKEVYNEQFGKVLAGEMSNAAYEKLMANICFKEKLAVNTEKTKVSLQKVILEKAREKVNNYKMKMRIK